MNAINLTDDIEPKLLEDKEKTVVADPQPQLGSAELIRMEDFLPKESRQRNLAANQLSPFEGSSIVRRIISKVTPSPAIYDPFAAVPKRKVLRLRDYIVRELNSPLECSAGADFFLRFVLPKSKWPVEKYGWCNDWHMTAGMNLFRKRSMQTPQPYRSDRIAFLDPLYCALWCMQYKRDYEGKEKKYVFPQGFVDMYNGKIPEFAATNKRWVRDVDTLYIAHNVNNTHWVAVEVDLMKGKIRVYDPDMSCYTDTYMLNTCRAYAKMIPRMIKQFSPPEMRDHITAAAYTMYRVKTHPQSSISGDCGVYTLKYIECLALGCRFDGMEDKYMPFIRIKYAAEIMDEIPEQDTISFTDPGDRRDVDKAVLISATQGLLMD